MCRDLKSVWFVAFVLAVAVLPPRAIAQDISREALEVGAAAVAKIVGTAVFLCGRDVQSVLDNEFAPEDELGGLLNQFIEVEVDREQRRVTASLFNVNRTAVYRPGLGCALVLGGMLPENDLGKLEVSPVDPATAPWPFGDLGATEPAPAGIDRTRLDAALEEAFVGHKPPLDPRTRAVVVVYDGKIVAERYGEGFGRDTPLHGWSMTKSVVDALVGLRVADGKLDVSAPTGLRMWDDASDQRAFLNLDTLLQMSSGLKWNERYDDLGADPVRMLFAEPDAASFAAARSVAFKPGSNWYYSSGTTNIICRVLRESFESDAEYHAFPRRRLFNKIGMRSAVIETDPSGTFVGSSLMYATARDWARFGMFYLDQGTWKGEDVLPDGWVATSTKPAPAASNGHYGRHWWLNAGAPEDPAQRSFPDLPRDLFYASGYEGQVLAVVPSRRAFVLRLGCTKNGQSFRIGRFLRSVLDALPRPKPRGYSIPVVDISAEAERQVVVDREPGQYLGHPTTTLLDDGETIFCVYPKGHGRGAIVYKRSDDRGRTWSERLPTPSSWATSKEVPTLFPVMTSEGRQRLVMFSGLYPIRMAHSDDGGEKWSELEPIGEFGGIVAMSSLVPLRDGSHMALFHDDGRFIANGGKRTKPPTFKVYKTVSLDDCLTWSAPEVIAEHPRAHLCEPGAIRSPDGSQIAVLLRENSRKLNGFVIFSDDEGETWSEPQMLPGALTGDRHTARYVADGKLFVSFRDTTLESETKGDWVAWVGSYEDIVNGREGDFRIRIMDNHHRWDCAYPAVEVLPDGDVVTTTYGHWAKGEKPYIVSVRLNVAELVQRAR